MASGFGNLTRYGTWHTVRVPSSWSPVPYPLLFQIPCGKCIKYINTLLTSFNLYFYGWRYNVWAYDLNDVWRNSLDACSGSEKTKTYIYLKTHNIFSVHSSFFQKTDLFLVCLLHYLSRAAVNIKGRDPSQARDVRTGRSRAQAGRKLQFVQFCSRPHQTQADTEHDEVRSALWAVTFDFAAKCGERRNQCQNVSQ